MKQKNFRKITMYNKFLAILIITSILFLSFIPKNDVLTPDTSFIIPRPQSHNTQSVNTNQEVTSQTSIAQTNPNHEWTEPFDTLNLNRWTQTSQDGTYSNWTAGISNGQYTFDKQEPFVSVQNDTGDLDYSGSLYCASQTANNTNCDDSSVENRIIEESGLVGKIASNSTQKQSRVPRRTLVFESNLANINSFPADSSTQENVFPKLGTNKDWTDWEQGIKVNTAYSSGTYATLYNDTLNLVMGNVIDIEVDYNYTVGTADSTASVDDWNFQVKFGQDSSYDPSGAFFFVGLQGILNSMSTTSHYSALSTSTGLESPYTPGVYSYNADPTNLARNYFTPNSINTVRARYTKGDYMQLWVNDVPVTLTQGSISPSKDFIFTYMQIIDYRTRLGQDSALSAVRLYDVDTHDVASNYDATGIHRSIIGYNITKMQGHYDYIGSLPTSMEAVYFYPDLQNNTLSTGDKIEVFLYTYTQADLFSISSFNSSSDSYKINYWNNTLQPIYNQTIDYTDTNDNYWNLTDLFNYYWSNKVGSDMNFSIAFQLYNATSLSEDNKTTYLQIGPSHSMYIRWKTYIADDSRSDMSVEIEPKDQFTLSSTIVYEKAGIYTWASTINRLEFGFGVETQSGSYAINTHVIKFVVYDDSGAVYGSWRDTSGVTQSVSLGVTLSEGQSYRLGFQVSKSDSLLQFMITEVGSNNYTSINWKSIVSNQATQRPSFFDAQPLEEGWKNYAPKRGYNVTLSAISTAIITGEVIFDIDQVYSTTGLLDTGYYCVSVGCTGSAPYGVFDDFSALGVHWYNQTNHYELTYNRIIRDFRSLSGLMALISDENWIGTNLTASITLYIGIYPLFKNGSVNTNGVSAYLKILGFYGFSTYWVTAGIYDDVQLTIRYPDLPSGKPVANFGFAAFWESQETLQFDLKYYNLSVSSTNPVVGSTYHDFDSGTSKDVKVILDYDIDQTYSGDPSQTNHVANGYSGYMKFSDLTDNYGQSLPYTVPSVPTPDVPYIPPQPTFLDNLWSGITGFAGGIWDLGAGIGGGIFGLILDSLSAIPDLITYIISLQWITDSINLILGLLIPAGVWLLSWIAGVWDTYTPEWIRGIVSGLWNLAIWILNFGYWVATNFQLVVNILGISMTFFICLLWYAQEDRALWDLLKQNVNPLAGFGIATINIPQITVGEIYIAILFVIFAPYGVFNFINFGF